MSWIIVALRAVRTAKDWSKKTNKLEDRAAPPPAPAQSPTSLTLKPIGPALDARAIARPSSSNEARPRPAGRRDAPLPRGPAPGSREALREAREARDAAREARVAAREAAREASAGSNGTAAPEESRERAPRSELPLHLIDRDALDVVRRLRRHGHSAYLVGGCVRDLSLGLTPKDFDVATSARPEEIRGIFRNCRIIGRRFRLAHVYFRGGKIIETATFRANITQPEFEEEGGEAPDLLIRQDNVFGTEEQDAQRRDFTINGLFFDPTSGRIIDHVGGRADLEARMVRMIGNPDVRLREDPVRILRAVRIAAKTKLKIDPELMAAMQRHKDEIARCSKPRLFEETMRLLRSGQAERSVTMLHEQGLLAPVLPALATFLDESLAANRVDRITSTLRALAALDEVARRSTVSDVVVIAAVFQGPLEAALDDGAPLETRADGMPVEPGERGRPVDKSQVTLYAQRFLLERAIELGATRKMVERLRQVVLTQRHFEVKNGKKPRRRIAPEALLKRAHFPESLDLFEILAIATTSEPHLSEVAHWRARATEPSDDFEDQPVVGATPTGGGGRRRRRRRGGRGDDIGASAD